MIALQTFHFVAPISPSVVGYKMEFHSMRIRQESENVHVFEEDIFGFQNCLQDGRWWLITTKNHPQTAVERYDAVGRTMLVKNAGRQYDPSNYNGNTDKESFLQAGTITS